MKSFLILFSCFFISHAFASDLGSVNGQYDDPKLQGGEVGNGGEHGPNDWTAKSSDEDPIESNNAYQEFIKNGCNTEFQSANCPELTRIYLSLKAANADEVAPGFVTPP